MAHITKLVSGGQTGADRAGLDAAMSRGVPHGGWCPAGRIAEDGTIGLEYNLRESESAVHSVRTEANVVDSDATLIFSFGSPTGGTAATVAYARRHRRPFLFLDLAVMDDAKASERAVAWMESLRVQPALDGTVPPGIVLNIAGPRESKCPETYRRVFHVVSNLLDMCA